MTTADDLLVKPRDPTAPIPQQPIYVGGNEWVDEE